MKPLLFGAQLITLFFTACNTTHTNYSPNTGYPNEGSPNLPSNPDPNKCYVRCISSDIYEIFTEEHLTYSLVEANKYQHKLIEIEIFPFTSK